ncbi:MAG: hypothetical protein WC613_00915 [Candidatus Aenigmatarchaeota archaeon]
MARENGIGSYGLLFGVLAFTLLGRVCGTSVTNNAVYELSKNGYEVLYDHNNNSWTVSQNQHRKGTIRPQAFVPFVMAPELELNYKDDRLEQLASESHLKVIKLY